MKGRKMRELSERAQAAHDRYKKFARAMQTGVALTMNIDPRATEPKHLRVGVNAAMVEHAALVAVLVDKGIMTWEEYYESLALQMEAEAKFYELKLEVRLA